MDPHNTGFLEMDFQMVSLPHVSYIYMYIYNMYTHTHTLVFESL